MPLSRWCILNVKFNSSIISNPTIETTREKALEVHLKDDFCPSRRFTLAAFESFDEPTLRAICNALGETDTGLTGSEIGQLLSASNIEDVDPTITKRLRLYEALSRKQASDNCGNNVANFIRLAIRPVRYIGKNDVFEQRRSTLNQILSFCGLSIGEDGEIYRAQVAKTVSQAQERANRLYRELISRKVHPDVLKFCRAELLQENYFHAVFEATKSIADKIREKSGLLSDGSRLVDDAFGGNTPLLAFNTLRTETERSEQTGLMNLIKGVFGLFRNTTAHVPKIRWTIDEKDALDMLTMSSLLHRRIDNSFKTRRT